MATPLHQFPPATVAGTSSAKSIDLRRATAFFASYSELVQHFALTGWARDNSGTWDSTASGGVYEGVLHGFDVCGCRVGGLGRRAGGNQPGAHFQRCARSGGGGLAGANRETHRATGRRKFGRAGHGG